MLADSYNRLAGNSAERLSAISDGIFAVVMTLLVLELRSPAMEGIHSEQGLWAALAALSPEFVTYLMSFLTLGIFWSGQQVQLNHVARSDRHLTWINLAFLFAVSIMPFSTRLLSEFIHFRTALIWYWANLLLLGLVLLASWSYASRAGLLKDDVTPAVIKVVRHRILIAQSMYALGALLSFFNTEWSIGFIVLVQLNYAIAPHFRNKHVRLKAAQKK